MERSTIEVNGIRAPLTDVGERSDEAVVFVHGNPGSGEDWSGLAAEVAGFGRAVAPDMPGFGGADKPADFNYTVEGYVAHLDAVLEACEVRRAHLVLHDLGGAWGLGWAALRPERVASVALVNVGVLPGYRWHYMARLWRTPILGEIIQATTTRPGFRLLLKHGNPRGLPREFVDRMYADYDRGTRRAILKFYRATSQFDAMVGQLTATLEPLDLDALVIWGKGDPYVPWKFAEAQKQVFPRAEIHYLEDSGHWPFADNPQAVSALLIPFLRTRVGRGN